MVSPQSSLRRRGRGSVSEPPGHARAESDGFGSFVDSSSAFPSSFDPGLSETFDNEATSSSVAVSSPTQARSDSTSQPQPQNTENEDADEWTEADMVSNFSPVETRFPKHHLDQPASASTSSLHSTPMSNSKPVAKREISGRGTSSEWADWNTFLAAHTLPNQQQTPSQAAAAGVSTDSKPTAPITVNPADDAFFDAFEVATNPNRAPSPPIIDLRGVEKKLEEKKKQHQQQKGAPSLADDDFFSRFERSPQTALGRASPLVLEPDQLESMHDASTSPLATSSSNSKKTDSYFELSAQPKPISGGGGGEQRRNTGSRSGGAFSPASPSSWTGSLRKTWTTLRGIQSEIVSHLPSASDFIVPAEEAEEAKAPPGVGAVDTKPGGGLLIASDAPSTHPNGDDQGRRSSSTGRRNNQTLPHASAYSQTTPFGSSSASSSGFTSGAAAPSHNPSAPLRARDLFASSSTASIGSHPPSISSSGTLRRGPMHSSTAPISGAPGFDTSSTRQWNTGHWTLDDEKQKRSIPVTLSKRRAETETVIEDSHAAQLQALLPPRLQLGKRWSLLYSLDQHGISLQTLYHQVSAGLDPMKRVVSGSTPGGGEESGEAEGWLRGASRETQEALGTRSNGKMHVGGGLSSISDAGLVIAIKDEKDHVFGAFVNEKLRPWQHYYGSGECFLWKTTSSTSENEEGRVERYKWTGRNDYMVLSESTFLSVGGGEGKFGLWLDGALEKGVSSCCPAFDNEVLCDGKRRGEGRKDGEGRFECFGLEVWAVGID